MSTHVKQTFVLKIREYGLNDKNDNERMCETTDYRWKRSSGWMYLLGDRVTG
jgi:hypothetical protein